MEASAIATDSPNLAPGCPSPVRLVRAGRPLALPLLLATLTGGCAQYYRPTHSGFLTDYNMLTPDRFHLNRGIGIQRAETYAASARDLAEVDSFFIEPVEWRVDPQSRGGKSLERRDWLCGSLDRALREQLRPIRPVVDRPGPRTARVRAAITVVRLSRPYSNVFLTATMISPYGVGPVFFGGGTVEAEVLAPDGRQIAAVSSASGGGWFDVVGYYARSNHARKAMTRCAEELGQALATPPLPPSPTPSPQRATSPR